MLSLFDYADLYRHDLAEQRALLRGVVATATRQDELHLRASAEAALMDVEHAIDLAQQRSVARAPATTRKATADLTVEVDALVRNIAQGLKFFAGQPAHPLQAEAAALLRVVLPKGLLSYIRADRDDRQTLAEAMADTLQHPAHAAVVEMLSLAPMAARLAALNPELATALLASPVEVVDAEAARRAASERTRHVILQVLAAYDPRDPAQAARRDAVLGELRAVQQRLKARYALPSQPATAEVCAPMIAMAK